MQRIFKSYVSLTIMVIIASCSKNDDILTVPPGNSLRFSIADAESYYDSVLSETEVKSSVFFSTSGIIPLWNKSKTIYSDDNTDIISVPALSRITYYAVPKNGEKGSAKQVPCDRSIIIRYDASSGFSSVAVQYTFDGQLFFTDINGNILKDTFQEKMMTKSLSVTDILNHYEFKKSIKLASPTKSPCDSDEFGISGMDVRLEDITYWGGWINTTVITTTSYYTIPYVYVPTIADYYGNPGRDDIAVDDDYSSDESACYTPLKDITDFAKNSQKVVSTTANIQHVHILLYDREKCFKGYDNLKDCMKVAKDFLSHFGVEPSYHSQSTDIATRGPDGEKIGVSSVKFDERLSSMIQNLDDGKPVVLGVTRSGFDVASSNSNNATQHFIVVTGYSLLDDGNYFFRFVETGRYQNEWEAATGNDLYNILYCNPDTQEFYGDGKISSKVTYNVTEIRDTYDSK